MRIATVGLCILLLAAAGCGSDSPAGPGSGDGDLSARIDGQQWMATQVFAQASQGAIAVSGGRGQEVLSFAWIDEGTGTYTIGSAVGTNGNFTTPNAGWLAVTTLGSGSIVVTTRTADRVAGTFSFTLVPAQGTQATGERVITNGVFDVRLR